MPRIEDPRITTRNAIITTPLPGASAERVEAQVTEPIETELREVVDVETIDSTSRPGVSVVSVELAAGVTRATNDEVFARVRDRLDDAAADLPSAAGVPEFDDKIGAVASTLIATVRWDGAGEPPVGIMSRVADDLGDRLRRVGGTEIVRLHGAVDEEYTVTVDTAEIAELGLRAVLAGALASWTTASIAGMLVGG